VIQFNGVFSAVIQEIQCLILIILSICMNWSFIYSLTTINIHPWKNTFWLVMCVHTSAIMATNYWKLTCKISPNSSSTCITQKFIKFISTDWIHIKNITRGMCIFFRKHFCLVCIKTFIIIIFVFWLVFVGMKSTIKNYLNLNERLL
jgi:hypothetical protein